ncbi:ubinuclein-1 [Arabidopsis lyrata subsp. lyrata]|uniref:ubinuclein-1 n=1 Tax=Arabidopsis lyrata subsp. lyrata TaxID=81972 RepID=UPI000A29C115|nr:ubinuclein-1 [Arabidopsis lyrata subsp. lyrata]|eukprot:XP_020890502.1 ubinuclein-1 [Arabidopsis lyrata subsp. lyrata]
MEDEPKLPTDDGPTFGESCKISSAILTAGDRKLLKVELLQEETTHVSWKKLMDEACKENGLFASAPERPPNANPNLDFRLAPGAQTENEMVNQPHPNRLNSVIAKIERLYMGKDGSDGEELDGAPDDDDYDTEDSFIDDAELDEYFEVDNSPIKHDGFFVNRGKLERIEPSATSNQQQPKKRRRKESAKPCGDVVDVSRKQAKMAKTAGGKDQSAAPGPSSKKISNDSKTVQDSFSPLKAQNGNDSLVLENVKHTDKANHQPMNATSPKSKAAGSSFPLHLKCTSKNEQSNSLPGISRPNDSAKSAVVRQQVNNGIPDLDIATESKKSVQISKKGDSNGRPKSSTLEKAIRELEKVVAESRPPAVTENQDADISSQAVKRGLPGDVKLNLAKVARIAHASQGDISGELINRLMSIVGHLIQIRSLKRNLKIMIDSSVTANREKDTRFQRIKNEIIEMLKTQVPFMESQETSQEAGTSDDFQDVGSLGKPPVKKFVMDVALEEKLCDLYDVFVEGMDEHSGPQIRKLYSDLAELWPNRLVDNHEIRRAICREKERRRALKGNLGKEMDQTKIAKKKETQLVPKSEGTTYPDKASGVGVKASVVLSATTTSLVDCEAAADSSCERSKQQNEKLKGTSSLSNPAAEGKTVRRKTEPAVEETQLPAEKPLVLALKQQTHPQSKAHKQAQVHPQSKAHKQAQVHEQAKAQTQTPPDLKLPS